MLKVIQTKLLYLNMRRWTWKILNTPPLLLLKASVMVKSQLGFQRQKAMRSLMQWKNHMSTTPLPQGDKTVADGSVTTLTFERTISATGLKYSGRKEKYHNNNSNHPYNRFSIDTESKAFNTETEVTTSSFQYSQQAYARRKWEQTEQQTAADPYSVHCLGRSQAIGTKTVTTYTIYSRTEKSIGI